MDSASCDWLVANIDNVDVLGSGKTKAQYLYQAYARKLFCVLYIIYIDIIPFVYFLFL